MAKDKLWEQEMRSILGIFNEIVRIIGYVTVGVVAYLVATMDPVYLAVGCTKSPCIVTHNYGGNGGLFWIAAYSAKWREYKIIIDGRCESACALFADKARPNVCITKFATFGFHQGTKFTNGRRVDPDFHSNDIYTWVQNNGGFPKNGMLKMKYNKAKKFWRDCK
jgi:hypothetical protein